MKNVSVSTEVFNTILSGFIAREADISIRQDNARRDQFLHAGNPLGRVLAWLWELDEDRAMLVLADYLGELREHNPSSPDPKISLENVLGALHLAWPATFKEDQVMAFSNRARLSVPMLFGGVVD